MRGWEQGGHSGAVSVRRMAQLSSALPLHGRKDPQAPA